MSSEIVIEKLDELLRPHLGEKEEVTGYKTDLLTQPGDNFGSTIISLDVEITNEESREERYLNLVNKMIPDNPLLQDVFNTQMTYVKEADFYVKAVPAMLKLQQDCSVPPQDWITTAVPKCYGARIGFGTLVDKDAAILLENVKYKGFEMKDRSKGLDYNHARLVLEKLAFIHALPIALKQKRPDDYETCILPATKHFMMHQNMEHKEEFTEKYRAMTKTIVESLPLEQTIQKRILKTFAEMDSVFQVDPKEPFLTIMHDDLWINNILFAPDTRTDNTDVPGEVVIVDFQLTRLNSPLCDVIFFLFSSVDTEVRKEHFDELFDVYYNNFIRCLLQVGCDTSEFPRSAVLAEMKRVAPAKLHMVFDRLRVMLAPKGVMGDPDWYMAVDLGGDEYTRRLTDIFLDFHQRGWLLEC